jgi:hypothetical protein
MLCTYCQLYAQKHQAHGIRTTNRSNAPIVLYTIFQERLETDPRAIVEL